MHVGDIESVYDSRTDGPAAGVDGLRLPSVSTVTAPRGRVKARGGRDVRSHVALMTLTAAPSQTPGLTTAASVARTAEPDALNGKKAD